MKRHIFLLLLISLSLSAFMVYYWVIQQPRELDTSWITTVNQFLEDSKPYPEGNISDLVLSRIYLFENGTDQLVVGTSAKNEFVIYLENLLLRVNKQKNDSITEVFVDKMLATGKVLELKYRVYRDFHLWKNFDTALLVLKDNLNEGLEGTIYIREIIEGNSQWSSWIILK